MNSGKTINLADVAAEAVAKAAAEAEAKKAVVYSPTYVRVRAFIIGGLLLLLAGWLIKLDCEVFVTYWSEGMSYWEGVYMAAIFAVLVGVLSSIDKYFSQILSGRIS